MKTKRAKVKRKYNYGGRYNNSNYLGSDIQLGSQIGAAAGSVIPGVGTALGSFAGGATGAATNKIGSFLNNNEALNKFTNTGFGKVVTSIPGGPLLGGLVLGSKKRARELEEAGRDENLAFLDRQDQFTTNRSNNIISTYPTQGVKGVQSFKYGGSMKKSYAKGGNMKKLSDDLSLFIGPTHQAGGITLDTDYDLVEDVEVEGDETVSNGNVYSNTLKPSKETKSAIKDQFGLSLKGASYADASKSIAKVQDKFSEIPKGKFGAATKKVMDQRTEEAMDLLFQDQEINKPVTSNPTMMQKGGTYGTDPDPIGPKPKRVPLIDTGYWGPSTLVHEFVTPRTLTDEEYLLGNETGSFNKPKDTGFRFYKDQGVGPVRNSQTTPSSTSTTSTRTNVPERTIQQLPTLDVSRLGASAVSSAPEVPNKVDMENISFDFDGDPAKLSGQVQGAINKNMNNLDLLGQGINAATYFANKQAIDRLDTNLTPQFVDSPTFKYRDRSDAMRSANRVAANNAINNLRRTSSQLNPSAIGAITAAEIAGNNQVEATEGQRYDRALQLYDQLQTNVSGQNARIANLFEQANTTLANDQIGLEVGARNAGAAGFAGNLQNQQARRMDAARALLTAVRGGDRGTVMRLLQDFPELANLLQVDPNRLSR